MPKKEPINEERVRHEDFVGLMVKKSNVREIAKPHSIQLSPTKKDETGKPYLIDKNNEDIKKIEKITKSISERIK